MSDEQSPEMGSRRRRREIREARERERAAQRENESAVRRLSSSSTADTTSSGSRGESSGSDAVFDQETTTPKDQRGSAASAKGQDFVSRRERRRLQAERFEESQRARQAEQAKEAEQAQQALPSEPDVQPPAPAQDPAPKTPSSPSTPFDHVVAPRSAETPEPAQEHIYEDELQHEFVNEHEYAEVEWDDDHGEFEEGHYEHDHDGAPVYVEASGYGRGYQTVSPAAGEIDLDMLKKRKAKKRRRNVTLTFALLGFGVLMVAFVMIVRSLLGDGGVNDYEEIAGDEVEFEILPGDGLTAVQNRLVEREIVASAEAFQDALTDLDEVPVLHAREVFGLHEQMPAADAVATLFEEDARSGYFNINAGFRLDQTLEAIANSTDVSMEELQELNQNPQQFGLPEEAEDLEGFVAPGEYHPDADATAEDIIEMVVEPTFERLDEAGVNEDDRWDTIIVASLITAEANNVISEERPREERLEDYRVMAGAINNRIENPEHDEIGGLLQIDAAVHYGTGSTGDLHFDDATRQDESNPYNTYQHPGLPPGPIAAPIPDTIEAAANPADTDAYYWVTVNPVTGETRFNETYAEHQVDTEAFVQFCEENEGACGGGDVESAEDELEG